jgi:hypothetical protein
VQTILRDRLPKGYAIFEFPVSRAEGCLDQAPSEPNFRLISLNFDRISWAAVAAVAAEAAASYIAGEAFKGLFGKKDDPIDFRKMLDEAIAQLKSFIVDLLEDRYIDLAARHLKACDELLQRYYGNKAGSFYRLQECEQKSNDLYWELYGRGQAALVPFTHAVSVSAATLYALNEHYRDQDPAQSKAELGNLKVLLEQSIAMTEKWLNSLYNANKKNISGYTHHWCEDVMVRDGETVDEKFEADRPPKEEIIPKDPKQKKRRCNIFWYEDGREVRYNGLIADSDGKVWDLGYNEFYLPAVGRQEQRQLRFESEVYAPISVIIEFWRTALASVESELAA